MAICPLLPRCSLKVNLEHYRNICSNIPEDKFKTCDHYKKLAGETRTPADWSELLRPTITR